MDEEVDAALMAAGYKMQQMQAEIERLRGIVPELLERLNDELCAENERLRAELAEAVTALPQAVRNERERWRTALGACDAALALCQPCAEPDCSAVQREYIEEARTAAALLLRPNARVQATARQGRSPGTKC